MISTRSRHVTMVTASTITIEAPEYEQVITLTKVPFDTVHVHVYVHIHVT